jgi:hypothetical protein
MGSESSARVKRFYADLRRAFLAPDSDPIFLFTDKYDSNLLINPGQNRWIVRPQLGVLHQQHQCWFELTRSV